MGWRWSWSGSALAGDFEAGTLSSLASSPILTFPVLWLLCAIFQPTYTFILLGAAAFPGGTGQIILELKDVHVFISGHQLTPAPLSQNGLDSESA